jgi:hypothetical protein
MTVDRNRDLWLFALCHHCMQLYRNSQYAALTATSGMITSFIIQNSDKEVPPREGETVADV